MHYLTDLRQAALCALLMAFLVSGCSQTVTPENLADDDDDDTNLSNDDAASNDDDDDDSVPDGDDDDDDSVPAGDDDTTDDDDDDDSVPDGDDDDSDEPIGDDDDLEGGVCAPTEAASCGWSVSANTTEAGATNAIDSYPCSSWDATGPELAYTFVPTESGSVTATLSDIESGQDLDLYILADEGAGCDSNTCYAYGNVGASFDVVAGETYYLVVDGYFGAAGSFVLDLACGDVTGDDDDSVEPGDDDDSVPGDDDDTPAPVDPEICNDGLDNDGNGSLDCDDPACSADPVCASPGEGVCSPDVTIAAGEIDTWANNELGSTNAIDSYSCVAWDESGPEYTYSYTAAVHGQATVNISLIADEIIEFILGPMEDLDLFILDANGGCDADGCVAYGDDTVSWEVTPGSTWYIVVDGHQGDASPYDLTLNVVETAPPAPTTEVDCTDGLDDDADGLFDCEDSDCATNATCNENVCIPSRVLSCGQTDSWSNDGFGSWNFVDSYGCNSWNESGPEYSYLFTAPANGSVTAALTNMDADLDVFIVGATDGQCDTEGACMTYGNTDATFDVVAGQQYHVVVDGFNGAVSDYDLTLSCN